MDTALIEAARAELAPGGVLRAGINLGNFLLVTGRGSAGEPQGVAPDMARAVADALGVAVAYVTYARPNVLADAADAGAWDIGLIGAEPARATKIAFTDAYAEIEATYLVPADSPLLDLAEVDAEGVRIAVLGGAAYDLWLERNIQRASLVRAASNEAVGRLLDEGAADVMAALRPGLIAEAAARPGTRILDGWFTTVQQAIGTPRANTAAARFLQGFVDEAKASGLVASLIDKHGVTGRLSVAR